MWNGPVIAGNFVVSVMIVKKIITGTSLALMLLACATMPKMSREDEWTYFEEWDTNRDVVINRSEFLSGYKQEKYFSTWAGKKKMIGNDLLASKIENAGTDLKTALVTQSKDDTIASARPEPIAEGQERSSVQEFVNKADADKSGSITQEEWATAMFNLGDENGDENLTPIEFYLWELLRG